MFKVGLIGSVGHQGYAMLGCEGNSAAEIAAFVVVDEEYDNFAAMIKYWYTDKGKEAPPIYNDYQKMLAEVKPEVVSISPAFFRHSEIALECIGRGIHTFCEKPVAFDLGTLKKMKALKEEKGVEFAGMHEMRYHPHFQAAYKALKEGRIGRPIQITGQKSYAFSDSRPQFYKKRETYGSTLCWVAIHAIDWTYWLMGDIQNIYAAHTTIGNMNYGECESSGVMAFTFKDGCTGTINFDFLKAHKDKAARDRCRIAGEKGVITIEEGKAFICSHDEELQELPLGEKKSFFADFIKQIKGEGKALLSAEETFEVTRLGLLALKSADENVLINTDDFLL